jgi:RNA polymerase sigma-70 factor (ECF subfamily)
MEWDMGPAPSPQVTGLDAARLIQTHQAGVWRYLRALGCEPWLADDLTQETFLQVLQRPFQEINAAATTAYLRKTALNLLISHERRAGRMHSVEAIEKLDQQWSRWAGQDDGELALDYLRECLQRLSARARLALELRFRDEQSRAQIAQALNLSEHGAKNLMQRAKAQLRACVEKKLRHSHGT